jgi:hypothetical protein
MRAEVAVGNVPRFVLKLSAPALRDISTMTLPTPAAFAHATTISLPASRTSSRPGERSFRTESVTLKLGLEPLPRGAPAESLQVTRIVCAAIEVPAGIVTMA